MINKKTPVNIINYYENIYAKEISVITDTIVKGNIKLCLISGPSCAGKTTTTKRICEKLAKKGIIAHMISIDDFYRETRYMPLLPDGSRDFESIQCIDTEYMHICLHSLCNGRAAYLPKFDFPTKRRTNTYEKLILSDNEIIILEGLHALNPAIYKGYVDEEKILGIFLDASTPKGISGDVRLIRRFIRDYYFRNVSVEETFDLWKSVKNGEKKYIFPYAHLADITVNTYYGYEMCVFKPYAQKLLKDISPESKYGKIAKTIYNAFEKYPSFDISFIPNDSLMWEFLKKDVKI